MELGLKPEMGPGLAGSRVRRDWLVHASVRYAVSLDLLLSFIFKAPKQSGHVRMCILFVSILAQMHHFYWRCSHRFFGRRMYLLVAVEEITHFIRLRLPVGG